LPISDDDKKAFENIVRALANQALVMVSCTDRKTGEDVTCLCAAVARTEHPTTAADLKFLPLARLFQGNPREEIFIPNEEAPAGGETKGAN
jgi:hypothetical protein